jgi:hypothetical protein
LYHSAVATIRREEMLEKINSRYKANVTVEDVLAQATLLKRLKIPFILVANVGFIVTVIHEFWRAYVEVDFDFSYLFAAYFILIWISFTIGFFIYGKRLMDLMPQNISKKLRKVTKHFFA